MVTFKRVIHQVTFQAIKNSQQQLPPSSVCQNNFFAENHRFKTRSLEHLHNQSDQVGLFFESLGDHISIFLTKVAQILGNFWGDFEKCHFYVKTAVTFFGQLKRLVTLPTLLDRKNCNYLVCCFKFFILIEGGFALTNFNTLAIYISFKVTLIAS